MSGFLFNLITRPTFWLLLALLAGAGFLRTWSEYRRPSRDFARIELGMTCAEVVGLFRAHPDDYHHNEREKFPALDQQGGFLWIHHWYFDEGIARIYFGEDQRVVIKKWVGPEQAWWKPDRPKFWQRCRRWIGI